MSPIDLPQQKPVESFSDDQLLASIKNVLFLESDSLKKVGDSVSQVFVDVVKKIYSSKGRVVFSGVGKSGFVARKMASTFSSTGTASSFLHPTDALHGDLGGLSPNDILFVISKSGETRELLDLLHAVKNMGLTTVSLVTRADSSLARSTEFVLQYYHSKEACPFDLAPTVSTTSTMAIGDALAMTVMKMREFKPQDFALLHPGGRLGERLHFKVGDIMIPIKEFKPLKPQNCNLEQVITSLGTMGLVLFADEDLVLKGILTDGDLRRALQKYREKILSIDVSTLMTLNPLVIDSEKTAFEALEFMEKRERPLNVIPVINKKTQKLVGVLRLHELLRIF
jgi:arabinose-5-phosphate isomerase